MNEIQLLVRYCSVDGNQHDPYAVAALSNVRLLFDTYHEKFCLFAQYLFSVVALLHVQLATIDIIQQTWNKDQKYHAR